MSYDIWLIRLLAINACSLFVFGLLLVILLLVSRRNSYYRRVGIAVPMARSSLERLAFALLRIAGFLFLVALLAFLAYFTIRYISQSELISGRIATLAAKVGGKNLTAPANSSIFVVYRSLEQLNNSQN
jgi:hypothetical protein